MFPEQGDRTGLKLIKTSAREIAETHGLVANDDVAALVALARHRLRERAWSPSALELFAVCPYRLALAAVMGLRERERRTRIARIDPASRGDISHCVQHRYLSGGADASLDAILDEEAAKMAEELAPAIPQLWAAAIETMRTDLHGWVAYRSSRERGWSTIVCEKEFADIPILAGWRVKGRVDLIERHQRLGLRATDHKTGRLPTEEPPSSTGHGEVLQPAIYALATEQMFSEPVSVGRLFYSTLRANYQTFDVPISDLTRTRVDLLLATIDRAIEKGFLPAAPREGACERCEFLPVCGPWEEERCKQKHQPALRPLKDVRGTP